MSAHGDKTRSLGAGAGHVSIMGAILAGANTPEKLKAALGGAIAGYHLRNILGRMQAKGWILIGKNGMHVLPAGMNHMPGASSQTAEMRPYVPPKMPPPRPGSQDFKQLPSISAGRAYAWRHPL